MKLFHPHPPVSVGLVMYMTAPEEPQVCLSKLKAKQVKSSTSVLCGHYRMNGSHVSMEPPLGGAVCMESVL